MSDSVDSAEFRITLVEMAGVRCDGVYVNRQGAWLGTVTRFGGVAGTSMLLVVPLEDTDGNFVQAPEDWRMHIIEQLPGVRG